MKKIYLILAIAGFIAPNIYTFKVSIETGNWLFLLDPAATLNGIFANDTSTAFIIDLIFGVIVFFIWSFSEATRLGIKNVWLIWLLTMLFGIGGSFTLFLYMRENVLDSNGSTKSF